MDEFSIYFTGNKLTNLQDEKSWREIEIFDSTRIDGKYDIIRASYNESENKTYVVLSGTGPEEGDELGSIRINLKRSYTVQHNLNSVAPRISIFSSDDGESWKPVNVYGCITDCTANSCTFSLTKEIGTSARDVRVTLEQNPGGAC